MDAYNQILELLNTLDDELLEKTSKLFKMLDSVDEMEDVIVKFKTLNNESWHSNDVTDFIAMLCGVKWQLKHFQKGQKKNLISPYKHTDYSKIKEDQDIINRKTASQFKTIDLE